MIEHPVGFILNGILVVGIYICSSVFSCQVKCGKQFVPSSTADSGLVETMLLALQVIQTPSLSKEAEEQMEGAFWVSSGSGIVNPNRCPSHILPLEWLLSSPK